ncbi:hypothetical protein, partial [Salmonella enterica]|uniref:hypothetical protein n=1 Tax=Salmonella enterica TaxID=28901 RepID=UPI001ADD5456
MVRENRGKVSEGETRKSKRGVSEREGDIVAVCRREGMHLQQGETMLRQLLTQAKGGFKIL